tara:strand:+ start:235 stop:423 length:189 start_codon:yes stop_codon:yes gene_type:complete
VNIARKIYVVCGLLSMVSFYIRGKNALFYNWGCMKETRRSNVSEALGWLVDAAMPLKNSRKG